MFLYSIVLKKPFVIFIRATKRKMELTLFQKQAVIKVIQKEDREKDLLKTGLKIMIKIDALVKQQT